MIIDAHAHIYPDKIAERAVGGIEDFYNMNVDYNGTLDTLLTEGGKAGVDRFLVQSVATVPEQVLSINNFISASVQKYPDKLIGFGAMHPDFADVESEVERMISLGLRGIKLHSDFQRFNIDDGRAFPIYECAEKAGLPILFHMGDMRYDFSSPERLLRVVERFPKLKVIGAHLMGWSVWDKGAELFADSSKRFENVYTDCSSSLYAMSPGHAAELIRKIGCDRVMWGTDYPMWSAKDELERFAKLPLTDEERELILSGNARRLLGET
ncbi:MAG: amidohydrolase family protein [Lachnospiraceae bacterium]|nr:amidohydrolase family protein [Ruminococcus sp.]MCM1275343.1 amidohydrolase family protein [Lachnospiraceae bacterium]